MPRYGTGADLARELGITRQAVHKAERSQRISRMADGRFDLDAAKIQYRLHTDPEQQLRAMQQPRTAVAVMDRPVTMELRDDAAKLVTAKARREEAEAELAELELAKARGEIVATSDHKRVVFALCRGVRDALLPLPDRLAPLLAAETDPTKVHQLMTVELRQILGTLAATDPDA